MLLILGHYTDVHSIFAGRVGGRREAQSIVDDNGHYSGIRSITTGRDGRGARASGVDHYQHYIDIDRVLADSGGGDQPTTDPGSPDQAVRSRGYEGLDPSVLATLRQPPRPHDYAGLGAGDAASTQQTAEQIEMTEITVSRQLEFRSDVTEYLSLTPISAVNRTPSFTSISVL